MPHICDLHSVGALISRTIGGQQRYLLINRSDDKGHAPVAGHVYDAHTDPVDAVTAEVREEAGLDIDADTLTLAAQGWRDNRCSGRVHRVLRPGHFWWIFEATATGEPAPCPEETRGADWATRGHLQALAQRTAAYALGHVSPQLWRADPGLEPVWCHWLCELDLVDLPEPARERIDALAATPPGDSAAA